MIYNTIVLCYMLLACFPWIENPELAAVQLILEHVSTFDVKLGRVVLTREGYNRAQELLPQLLVLAARNNLACPADLTPSFMNIFVIIQTIVDPLVKNLTPEERTAVYATKYDALKFSDLPLDCLQADVDQWVCNNSELDPLRPLSAPSSPLLAVPDYIYNLCASDHGEMWRHSVLPVREQLQSAQSEHCLVRKPAMRGANNQTAITIRNDTSASHPRGYSDVLCDAKHSTLDSPKPLSSSPSPHIIEDQIRSLAAHKHDDVWWLSNPSNHEQTCSTLLVSSLARKPVMRKIETQKTTTQARPLAAKLGFGPIRTLLPLPVPLPDGTYDLRVQGHGDVWWNMVSPTQAQSSYTNSGASLAHLPAVQKTDNLGVSYISFDQTNSLIAIPGSNLCLHTAPHGASTPTVPISPGLLGTDDDNTYLRAWMTPSNARSFESFPSSPASFGPSTPIDRPYSPWQSPLSEIDYSIVLGSEASSEDLHMRSHSEVRKAEEVTVQRKFVRKLRAALVAIRFASN